MWMALITILCIIVPNNNLTRQLQLFIRRRAVRVAGEVWNIRPSTYYPILQKEMLEIIYLFPCTYYHACLIRCNMALVNIIHKIFPNTESISTGAWRTVNAKHLWNSHNLFSIKFVSIIPGEVLSPTNRAMHVSEVAAPAFWLHGNEMLNSLIPD